MKLLVDIPDYDLQDVKNASIACGMILTAIKNGIPYEEIPNGDLISRDVLKAQVNKPIECAVDEFDKGYNTAIQGVIHLINSAPTVTPDYDTGYQDGLEDGLNDIRPKGEWIKNKYPDGGYNFTCTNCSKLYPDNTDYCPNCGAQMVGGYEWLKKENEDE